MTEAEALEKLKSQNIPSILRCWNASNASRLRDFHCDIVSFGNCVERAMDNRTNTNIERFLPIYNLAHYLPLLYIQIGAYLA